MLAPASMRTARRFSITARKFAPRKGLTYLTGGSAVPASPRKPNDDIEVIARISLGVTQVFVFALAIFLLIYVMYGGEGVCVN